MCIVCLLYYVSTSYNVIIHMMAGRIDDEKLYKRGLNREPTKSVSTLILSFNWISPSFSDLKAIVLSHSRETLTLAYNSSFNLIFLTKQISANILSKYLKFITCAKSYYKQKYLRCFVLYIYIYIYIYI